MLPFISIAFLALVLGFKHSYDADHLIAVSSFLRRSKTFKQSIKVGFSWALGHMITASIITLLLFALKETLLKKVLSYFELGVAIMLILLGIWSILDGFRVHMHLHKHGLKMHTHMHTHMHSHSTKKQNHDHKHMFGIGILHGLASNDELLILFTASLAITSIGQIVGAISIFSLGVIIGMVVFSMVFSYLIAKHLQHSFFKGLSIITGVISIGYGVFSLSGIL